MPAISFTWKVCIICCSCFCYNLLGAKVPFCATCKVSMLKWFNDHLFICSPKQLCDWQFFPPNMNVFNYFKVLLTYIYTQIYNNVLVVFIIYMCFTHTATYFKKEKKAMLSLTVCCDQIFVDYFVWLYIHNSLPGT